MWHLNYLILPCKRRHIIFRAACFFSDTQYAKNYITFSHFIVSSYLKTLRWIHLSLEYSTILLAYCMFVHIWLSVPKVSFIGLKVGKQNLSDIFLKVSIYLMQGCWTLVAHYLLFLKETLQSLKELLHFINLITVCYEIWLTLKNKR